MRSLLMLFLVLLPATVIGTTFIQVPVEEQIQEADGLIQGHFLKKNSIKLENGMIATQMHFELKKEVGLNSDFFGLKEVIVHYPGGILEDESTRVEGVPEFVEGEKVLLLLKNKNNRFWGLNLSYGSFKVVNFGRSTMVMNYLFPEQANAGQLKLEHFERIVRDIKGSSFKVVQNQTQVEEKVAESSGQNRSIASIEEQGENKESRPERPVFWLIAFLSLMGGLYRWSQRQAN